MTLEEYHTDKRSAGERLFDAIWEQHKPAGVPDPECEVEHLIPGRKHRVDRFFRAERLIVEIDGGQRKQFGGRHNTDGDRWKINTLTMLGYCVLRYSPEMLEADPEGVIAQVADALKSRGRTE